MSNMFFKSVVPEMLYVHLPFCKNKCTYCDFVALEGHSEHMVSYHKALCAEIRQFSVDTNGPQTKIRTLFFGGGTPSIYPLDLFEDLMKTLRESFDISEILEVTLEINPGDLTEEHFIRWARAGVSRASIGVQVLDQALLQRFNRYQSNTDAAETVLFAAKHMRDVSVDLIIGLPGVTEKVWRETLDKVCSWPLSHVSLYILTVHEHTRLYYGLTKGEMALPPDEKLLKWYEQTMDCLTKAGFCQYEISNFARNNRESLHNHGYWNRSLYKGFGLGAASYDGRYRFSNEKNLSKFIQQFIGDSQKSWHYVPFCEELTNEQHRIEQIMLSLRRRAGLELVGLQNGMSEGEWRDFADRISMLEAAGYVKKENNILTLTRRGMLCENDVVAQLIAASSRE